MEPPPAAADRDAQMDAIRRMLNDLKETASKAPSAPEPQPAPRRDPAAASIEVPEPDPVPDDRVYNPFEEQTTRQSEVRQVRRRTDDDDPLKARIEDAQAHDRAVKGEPVAKQNYDAHRLRKKHEKRAKRMQRARERRRATGGFMTGFLLVAIVAGTMSGLYSFHRQIIAYSPELEPAMIEYVTVVDQYRVQLLDSTVGLRAWVDDKIKDFKKEDKGEGGGAATSGDSG